MKFRIACVVLVASVVVVAYLAVSPGTAESSGAGPDCSGWLTEEFWQAAAVEDAERCLAAGEKVNARDWEDFTPLHWAAMFSKTDIVKALIAAGAKVDARIDYGLTPLHYAARPQSFAEIPLREATILNAKDTVNALIVAGAKVDAQTRDDGLTPLLGTVRAPYTGRAEVLKALGVTAKALIAAGAKVNARDRDGLTPLHWAAQLGMTDAVNALIAVGAKVDARTRNGWTPLHYAAGSGRAELIVALLDSGASAAARTDSSDTAFDLARIYQAVQAKRLRADALRGTDALRRLRDATPK